MSRRRPPSVSPSSPKPKRSKRPGWDQVQLVELVDATRYNDDVDIADAVYLIRQLKQQTTFLRALRRLLGPKVGCFKDPLAPANVTGPERGEYAKGGKGDFVLLYLAFVLLDKTAMMALLDQPHTFEALFKECGFSEPPDYQLLRLRFIELEEHWKAFAAIGDQAIQQARRHRPEIGRIFHVDGRAYETHARPEHCCPRSRKCKRSHGRRAKRWVDRAPVKLVKDERAGESERPMLEPGEFPSSVAPRVNVAAADVPPELVPDGGVDAHHAYFILDGCIFRARDTSCGMRAYDRKGGEHMKSWVGGFGQAAVDAVTGGPLALEVFSADDFEFRHYGNVLAAVQKALGDDDPWAMTGDAGLSYTEIFERNTRESIATVVPWRPRGNNPKGLSKDELRQALRCELYDEYGIPRCRKCGGEAEVVTFFVDKRNDKPYLRYRCLRPWLPECEGEKRIACEADWTMLVPLPRVHPLYNDLHTAHFETAERFFANFCSRYYVFGDDKSSRLKRFRSLDAQRLRAQAARLLEWFRICLRYGWLAGHKTIKQVTLRPKNGIGANGHQGLLFNRRKRRLDLPYGSAAVRCGLARAGPPPAPPPGRAKIAAALAPLPPISADVPF